MELHLASILCAFILNGETETRHNYTAVDRSHYVRVDCETPTHVIEIGRDVRSARDSVHQTLWAARLSGKAPAIILIDTDGYENAYERQIKEIAATLDIGFHRYKEDYLRRVEMLHLWPGFKPEQPSFAAPLPAS